MVKKAEKTNKTTKPLQAISIYDYTADTPRNQRELIHYVVRNTTAIFKSIRELQKQIDILMKGMDAQESNYKRTNDRNVEMAGIIKDILREYVPYEYGARRLLRERAESILGIVA